ncbi:MAG: hypothetical protein H7318_00565 [Oligoflexus sp.]|nr:hypothetical protein [Oligoflexus sp.]
MNIRYVGIAALALSSSWTACGKKDNKNDYKNNLGLNGQAAATVTADFSGAIGVLVIDSSAVSGLRLQGASNLSLADSTGGSSASGNASGDGSLVKVGSDGEVKPALSSGTAKANNNMQMALPKVQTIAVSPSKEIYLHFERAFVYKNPENTADWSKVNDMANGYQCQIFKVTGGNIDELRVGTPPADVSNLECLDNQHFVDSWLAQRNSVFQFDSASNVYYPGSLPNGGGKMVVYKYDVLTKKTTEVINSNICVQDFLVTKAGGVFYTGTSSCQGSGSDAGGFFRYVSPTSEVREIARDWWNFVFEPVQGDTTDQAVFFGPDPRSATTASWNSACLFNFNPVAGTTAALSISEKITCGADIQSWINMTRTADVTAFGNYNTNSNNLPAGWVAEYKNRCTSSGQVFAGGGSQISSIKQDSAGEVYVIGRVRKKKAGELSCSLSVKGPHCVVNGAPYLPGQATYGSAALCQAAGGAWTVDEGFCNSPLTTRDACLVAAGTHTWNYREVQYHNVVSVYCGETAATNTNFVAPASLWNTVVSETESGAGTATAYGTTKFSRGWMNCQIKGATSSMGGEWTDEYKGLGKVKSATKTLELLSGTDEQAIRLWLVGDVPYYSTFNTTQGKYYLKRWDTTNSTSTPVAENFEAYNLTASGDDARLFYDGLDFSTNAYSFGTMAVAAPYARTIKTGLTGTVKTIVILPK